MKIRIARNENDSISASRIYSLSWKAAYKGIFSDALLNNIPLDFWVSAFNGNYVTDRFEIAIMSSGRKDIGAGGYGRSRDHEDQYFGEITSVYFLEEAWGKGYAGQLMDFMIHRLKSNGFDKAHIWVLKENQRARRFYEKYGFSNTEAERTVTFKGESKAETEYVLDLK
jgi:ribosomal protein S18 acetylase RimI-like enzyme